MKKTSKNSIGRDMKLSLNRETLRQLTSLRLKEAVGGNPTDFIECELTVSLNCVPH